MSTVIVQVTSSVMTHESVSKKLADPGHGAWVLFWGIVRNRHQGRQVLAVTYDAYVPLAEKTFRDLAEEVRQRWGGDLRVVIIHRVGRLEVGEASVVIGVSSAHRDEAYQASRYLIEQIKVRAPIWKQEHYADGDSEWIAGHSLLSSG